MTMLVITGCCHRATIWMPIVTAIMRWPFPVQIYHEQKRVHRLLDTKTTKNDTMWSVRPIYIIRVWRWGHGFTWGEANLLHICLTTTRGSGTKQGAQPLLLLLSSFINARGQRRSSAWLPGEFTIQVGLPCRQIHVQYTRFCRETQQNAPSRVKYHFNQSNNRKNGIKDLIFRLFIIDVFYRSVYSDARHILRTWRRKPVG